MEIVCWRHGSYCIGCWGQTSGVPRAGRRVSEDQLQLAGGEVGGDLGGRRIYRVILKNSQSSDFLCVHIVNFGKI